MDLRDLRSENQSRRDQWHSGTTEWTGADWSNEMCGEAGEAANVVKKIRRVETGAMTGMDSRDTEALVDALALELADVVICADLLAMHYGISLSDAVVRKFNLVSEKRGFPQRICTDQELAEAMS